MDLNLLVVLDALATERHVTRAARRVGITQPAMSNALRRLRQLFDDDLYLRGPTGMEPTARALELVDGVRQTLRHAERLLSTDLRFDPATSRRTVTGRMSDLIGFLILPWISSYLRESAPQVSLEVMQMTPEGALKALEGNQLDFAISLAHPHPASIRSAVLMQDRVCCVMGPSHPLASAKMTLERFLAAHHLRVAMSPIDKRMVDDVLAARGLGRSIVATVPHWMLVPPLVQSGKLVAVLSRRFAARFEGQGMVVRSLPLESKAFDWMLYWHRRDDPSAAHLWMRELLHRACREVELGSAKSLLIASDSAGTKRGAPVRQAPAGPGRKA